MANSWGESGTTWGQGDWGQQNVTTIYPTTFSITASLGDVDASHSAGWGRLAWGQNDWGEAGSTITPTGFSITASLGTLAYAASIEGWGRDEWGYGNWGENTTTVIVDGFEMSGDMGLSGWGRDTWGHSVWGEESILTIEIGAPLTGLAATGSLGTLTLNYDFKFTLSDSLLGTLSRGVLSINDGADHTQGVAGIAATMSLGTLTVTDIVFGPSSFLATASLGTTTLNYDFIFTLSDSLLLTASRGVLTINNGADHTQGVGGIAATMSLGSLAAIDDMRIGVSGFEVTGSLGSGGVSPLHYKDVDITGYTAYTDIEHSA